MTSQTDTCERPVFYKNTLRHIPVTIESLSNIANELHLAILEAVKQIIQHINQDVTNLPPEGALFGGKLGIKLMFLRLNTFRTTFFKDHIDVLEQLRNVLEFSESNNTDSKDIEPGRYGLITSPTFGQALMRSLFPDEVRRGDGTDDINLFTNALTTAYNHDIFVDFRGHKLGGDDTCVGRAGLLWALLNIRKVHNKTVNGYGWAPLLQNIPRLAKIILEAGLKGSKAYVEQHGTLNQMPLMWPWIGESFSTGLVHGISGIICVLLACEPSEISEYLPLIVNTITSLCNCCVNNHGYLPASLPSRPPPWNNNLIQICHGSPAIPFLLAVAKDQLPQHQWQPQWDAAMEMASEKIWEEGLLSKGGSICHGIAGNAWPWLMYHYHNRYGTVHNDRDKSDIYFSRALSFLLEAKNTQPYHNSTKYRLPDRPYGLFEGLSGTVLVWTEACQLISLRLAELRGQDSMPETKHDRQGLYGLPGHGGYGLTGFL